MIHLFAPAQPNLMTLRIAITFLTFAACVFVYQAAPALADSFVWQDARVRATIAYPDDWKIVANQKPDDVLTIAAPGQGAYAACRLRIRDDRRFVIYPKPYAGEVQRLYYSEAFWRSYVGEFEDSVLLASHDDAALALGAAGYAQMRYVSTAGLRTERQALAAVSNYYDKNFIVECSAQLAAFERWAPVFMAVIKSLRMDPVIQPVPTGTYRDFLSDPPLLIRGTKGIDLFVY